jgi:thiol:disulfide interchange protein DsbD
MEAAMPASAPDFLAHGLPWAYGAAFAGGFLTSLTPCVYPLIPITVSLFGARGEGVPRARAVALAGAYVAGIAAMYAALGTASALLGRAFGTFMANPWVIVPIALLFAAMAASMFGAFALQLPPTLQERLTRVGGKRFGGAFAMGLVGGVIAAPCTGPVLASILACVATTRSVALGASLLATYALGLGVLVFLSAAIAAFAVALPRSGAWMEVVRRSGGRRRRGCAARWRWRSSA